MLDKKLIITLVIMLFIIWYAPLVLPVATLHRYGLEEMRVAFVFFLFGVLFTTIWLRNK
jgi:hypothetical protein